MSLATRIAALEAAIGTGALSVTDENGRSVRYANPSELLGALAALKGQERLAAGGSPLAYRKVAHGSAHGGTA